MRIEILRKDNDPLVILLWEALFPIKDNRIMVYMSSDLGKEIDQRIILMKKIEENGDVQ